MDFSPKNAPKRRIDTILPWIDPGKQGIINDIITLPEYKQIETHREQCYFIYSESQKKTKGNRNYITYKDIAALFGETETNICYFMRMQRNYLNWKIK